MISIIISTRRNHTELNNLTDNIKQTIGIDFELIIIENNSKYSLCEAYNLGIKKSIYNYFCFVHDDVIFKTENWGRKLVSRMENDSKIGLIGVAGTKFKSSYPSAWGQSPYLSQFKRGNIYQKTGNEAEEYIDLDINSESNEIEDVVCLDGVFLFSRSEIVKHCQFDQNLLTHFHGYDIDFSLQVFFSGYRVIIDRKLLLTHYSNGNYSGDNTIANRKISWKWKFKLPIATKDTNLNIFQLYYFDCLNWYYFLTTALKRKIHIQ